MNADQGCNIRAQELSKGDRVLFCGEEATVTRVSPLPGGDLHLRVRMPDGSKREGFPATVATIYRYGRRAIA